MGGLRFVTIELKQIYCSYVFAHLQFFSGIIFEGNIFEQIQALLTTVFVFL